MFGLFSSCSPEPSQKCCECGEARAEPSQSSSAPIKPQRSYGGQPPNLSPEADVCVPPPARENRQKRTLTVPTSFNRFQISMIYTHLGATQGTLMEQQRTMLHAVLRSFTKELARGVDLSILTEEGKLIDCYLLIDRKLVELTVTAENLKKVIPVKDLVRVCAPEEIRNINTTNQQFVDELCATLVLAEGKFVTFRFESTATREYFCCCLHVLRMAQDTAHDWYR